MERRYFKLIKESNEVDLMHWTKTLKEEFNNKTSTLLKKNVDLEREYLLDMLNMEFCLNKIENNMNLMKILEYALILTI